MATSGSYTFNLNKLQIITEALDLLNLLNNDGSFDSLSATRASNKLNMMIKLWEAEGIHLWKRRQATLFTQSNQVAYQLGSVTGADNCTNSYIATTTTAAVAAGISILPLTSVTGLTAGMNIGLELDNETRQWGTISSISGNNVTVSFSTSSAAASGQTVVAYSSLINRPLKILRATYIDLKAQNTEVTLNKMSYDDYFNLPNKTFVASPPTSFYYDKVLNNALPYTGTIYIYPSPNVTSKLINFTYLDSIQDMLNNSDDADFPQEWLYPLIFNLACELAYSYDMQTKLQVLQPKAQMLKETISQWDTDDEDLHISIDWSAMNKKLY